MADEKPDRSLSEALAALLKRFPPKPKGMADPGPFGDFTKPDGGEASASDVMAALEALTKQSEEFIKVSAQQRAAETNSVDSKSANAWLKEHWIASRQCAVCTSLNWGLSTTFAHLPETVGKIRPAGRAIPFVVLTCRTCGNPLFLNAIVMGLLPGTVA